LPDRHRPPDHHLKKNPAKAIDNTQLMEVKKENVEQIAKQWEKWLPK
jgi:hypothetical protein